MSILDEVIPDDDQQSSTTTFIDGAQVFTPRTVSKVVLGELMVNTTTTPKAETVHYSVGNVNGTVYHMFHAPVGMPVVDVLAMAYRNVFMWIRPQGPNGIYYEPHKDHQLIMEHLNRVIHDLVGNAVSAKMTEEYFEERSLAITPGEKDPSVYRITRTYNRAYDRLTTIIMELPGSYGSLSADELFEEGLTSTLQVTPAWLDPGDFMPGVWTPDPNADNNVEPA
ncbi:hypothetical protein pEaSNUABM37_00239 [Erwinia phage pEa_SNUABM_37]|nr:hypothetical protein pEaSNUABM37_00239 [Erwinia phage pEa_SNUABM_37]QXO10707.1 hypothetical protein pEaSNUABM48_00239 [Erwinia phage pEa_SNUABM_48]